MVMENLKDLYIDELKDVYNAEHQLVKALPKMAKASASPQLRMAFEGHLKETQGHVKRLEQVFAGLGEKAAGKTCKAMEGLVKEGAEMIEEDAEGALKDAGLIGAAQRVEHYEIAAYGTLIAFAKELGDTRGAKVLQQTLDEEGAADKKLSGLARTMNTLANQEGGDEDSKM
jgi:ferritin-like metal-binding protein YciE